MMAKTANWLVISGRTTPEDTCATTSLNGEEGMFDLSQTVEPPALYSLRFRSGGDKYGRE